jgi:hypothetical protein
MRHGGESGGGRPQGRTRFLAANGQVITFFLEAQCVSWSPSSSHHRSSPCLADREVSWVGLSPPPPSFSRDFLESKVETRAVCQAIYGRHYKLSDTLPRGFAAPLTPPQAVGAPPSAPPTTPHPASPSQGRAGLAGGVGGGSPPHAGGGRGFGGRHASPG